MIDLNRAVGGALLLALCMPVFGSARFPWRKPADSWTREDAVRILTNSPWAQSPKQRFIVRWEDALPIQQALAKVGAEPAIAAGSPYYAVAVVVPPQARLQDWTKARASLTTGGNSSTFSEVRTSTQYGMQVVIFLFPKTIKIGEPASFRLPFVTIHSLVIEFRAHTDTFEIKQAFPLQDLYYLGRFEI